MELLETYLPAFQFSERHALDIPASPAATLAAVLRHQPSDDAFFRWAIALREWPMKMASRAAASGAPAQAPFGKHNFTLLERCGDRELVFGLAGRFWRMDYGQSPIADARDFLSFDQAGTAKLVLGFKTEALGSERTRLTTETRVFCLDRGALRRFAPYWYLIRPVSGLIRQRMLAGIRRLASAPVDS